MPGRRLAIVAAAFVALGLMACGPKPVSKPTRPGQALIALLPDSDTGSTGRATVSNNSGSVDLGADRDATLVTADRRPGPISMLSQPDVERLFGDALSALPPAPEQFTLYFRFQSEELTVESRDLLRDVLRKVRNHPVPDVLVVGHTDTTGAASANVRLGLKRATMVRDLLVKAGLEASRISVTSHGERDLLVQTPDETFEPRNRRVEVAVR
jgi:outer membrane protein OmpA-like peptidoglycan-associated protein